MEQWDVIIIGGGAAGLIAAGSASRGGAKVLVLEKTHRVGRKLSITGKGRCNVTTALPVEQAVDHYPSGGPFLQSAFSRFFAGDIIDLLERRDVPCVTERGQRVFPKSGKAGDVVNALYRYARSDGAAVRTKATVSDIETHPVGFLLTVSGKAMLAQRVIIATGGKSYPKTGSTGDGYRWAQRLGHSLTPPRPTLVPLMIAPLPVPVDVLLRNVGVTLLDGKKKVAEGFGEAQLDTKTLSGAIPLDLSRDIMDRAKPVFSIDFKPALDEEKLDARLRRDLELDGKRPLRHVLSGLLPKAAIPLFVALLGLDAEKRCAEVNKKTRTALRQMLKDFRLPVTATRGYDEALVTAGGVPLDEVDPRTLESKIAPKLYFCGEVLDIDAKTGGFNLQAAFSTGFVAGQAAGTAK
jgi:predicted Rossmann fold flavoprotein